MYDLMPPILTLLAIQGAVLLLSSFPPAARHIVHAAFDKQGRGKQLVSMSNSFAFAKSYLYFLFQFSGYISAHNRLHI